VPLLLPAADGTSLLTAEDTWHREPDLQFEQIPAKSAGAPRRWKASGRGRVLNVSGDGERSSARQLFRFSHLSDDAYALDKITTVAVGVADRAAKDGVTAHGVQTPEGGKDASRVVNRVARHAVDGWSQTYVIQSREIVGVSSIDGTNSGRRSEKALTDAQ